MLTDYEAVPGNAERDSSVGGRARGRIRCLREKRTCYAVWKVPVLRTIDDKWTVSGPAQLHAASAAAIGAMLVTYVDVDFGGSASRDGVAFFFICNRHHGREFMRGEVQWLTRWFSILEPTEPTEPTKPNETEVRALIDAACGANKYGHPFTP